MERGDLSNAIVPRWMFTLEALTEGHPLPQKRFWRTWTDLANETPIPRGVLGTLWAFFQRTHVVFEVVTFGLPDAYCDALMERLDREGVHPVRYVTPYGSREMLADSLAFRPDVQSVVDLPEFAWQWGGRGMSVAEVTQVG